MTDEPVRVGKLGLDIFICAQVIHRHCRRRQGEKDVL